MKNENALRNLCLVTAFGMFAGLYLIFFWVPTEAFSGIVQRLFYIHVPSAWVAYLAFTIVLIASIAYLVTRRESWDVVAHSSAEVGVVFTGITLVTGMMWGRPVWGTYWQWEPRLTMTLILFLIYVGYLTFRSTANDQESSRQIAAVIGIAGFVTVPLVHFSVRWWRGLHPSGVVNPGSESDLPAEMLITLLFMVVVLTLLYSVMLGFRVRMGRMQNEITSMGVGA